MLSERQQVGVVVRNILEFDMAGMLKTAKYAPFFPFSACPPQDLASDEERRFPFEYPYESHLRSGR